MKSVRLLTAAAALLAAQVSAYYFTPVNPETLYVSPDGTDDLTCGESLGDPCRTLQYTFDYRIPYDTNNTEATGVGNVHVADHHTFILMLPGTYTDTGGTVPGQVGNKFFTTDIPDNENSSMRDEGNRRKNFRAGKGLTIKPYYEFDTQNEVLIEPDFKVYTEAELIATYGITLDTTLPTLDALYDAANDTTATVTQIQGWWADEGEPLSVVATNGERDALPSDVEYCLVTADKRLWKQTSPGFWGHPDYGDYYLFPPGYDAYISERGTYYRRNGRRPGTDSRGWDALSGSGLDGPTLMTFSDNKYITVSGLLFKGYKANSYDGRAKMIGVYGGESDNLIDWDTLGNIEISGCRMLNTDERVADRFLEIGGFVDSLDIKNNIMWGFVEGFSPGYIISIGMKYSNSGTYMPSQYLKGWRIIGNAIIGMEDNAIYLEENSDLSGKFLIAGDDQDGSMIVANNALIFYNPDLAKHSKDIWGLFAMHVPGTGNNSNTNYTVYNTLCFPHSEGDKGLGLFDDDSGTVAIPYQDVHNILYGSTDSCYDGSGTHSETQWSAVVNYVLDSLYQNTDSFKPNDGTCIINGNGITPGSFMSKLSDIYPVSENNRDYRGSPRILDDTLDIGPTELQAEAPTISFKCSVMVDQVTDTSIAVRFKNLNPDRGKIDSIGIWVSSPGASDFVFVDEDASSPQIIFPYPGASDTTITIGRGDFGENSLLSNTKYYITASGCRNYTTYGGGSFNKWAEVKDFGMPEDNEDFYENLVSATTIESYTLAGILITKSQNNFSDTGLIDKHYGRDYPVDVEDTYNASLPLYAYALYEEAGSGDTVISDTSVNWDTSNVVWEKRTTTGGENPPVLDEIKMTLTTGSENALNLQYIYDSEGDTISGMVVAKLNDDYYDTIHFRVSDTTYLDAMVIDTAAGTDAASSAVTADTVYENGSASEDTLWFYAKALSGGSYIKREDVDWTYGGFVLNSVTPSPDSTGTDSFYMVLPSSLNAEVTGYVEAEYITDSSVTVTDRIEVHIITKDVAGIRITKTSADSLDTASISGSYDWALNPGGGDVYSPGPITLYGKKEVVYKDGSGEYRYFRDTVILWDTADIVWTSHNGTDLGTTPNNPVGFVDDISISSDEAQNTILTLQNLYSKDHDAITGAVYAEQVFPYSGGTRTFYDTIHFSVVDASTPVNNIGIDTSYTAHNYPETLSTFIHHGKAPPENFDTLTFYSKGLIDASYKEPVNADWSVEGFDYNAVGASDSTSIDSFKIFMPASVYGDVSGRIIAEYTTAAPELVKDTIAVKLTGRDVVDLKIYTSATDTTQKGPITGSYSRAYDPGTDDLATFSKYLYARAFVKYRYGNDSSTVIADTTAAWDTASVNFGSGVLGYPQDISFSPSSGKNTVASFSRLYDSAGASITGRLIGSASFSAEGASFSDTIDFSVVNDAFADSMVIDTAASFNLASPGTITDTVHYGKNYFGSDTLDTLKFYARASVSAEYLEPAPCSWDISGFSANSVSSAPYSDRDSFFIVFPSAVYPENTGMVTAEYNAPAGGTVRDTVLINIITKDITDFRIIKSESDSSDTAVIRHYYSRAYPPTPDILCNQDYNPVYSIAGITVREGASQTVSYTDTSSSWDTSGVIYELHGGTGDGNPAGYADMIYLSSSTGKQNNITFRNIYSRTGETVTGSIVASAVFSGQTFTDTLDFIIEDTTVVDGMVIDTVFTTSSASTGTFTDTIHENRPPETQRLYLYSKATAGGSYLERGPADWFIRGFDNNTVTGSPDSTSVDSFYIDFGSTVRADTTGMVIASYLTDVPSTVYDTLKVRLISKDIKKVIITKTSSDSSDTAGIRGYYERVPYPGSNHTYSRDVSLYFKGVSVTKTDFNAPGDTLFLDTAASLSLIDTVTDYHNGSAEFGQPIGLLDRIAVDTSANVLVLQNLYSRDGIVISGKAVAALDLAGEGTVLYDTLDFEVRDTSTVVNGFVADTAREDHSDRTNETRPSSVEVVTNIVAGGSAQYDRFTFYGKSLYNDEFYFVPARANWHVRGFDNNQGKVQAAPDSTLTDSFYVDFTDQSSMTFDTTGFVYAEYTSESGLVRDTIRIRIADSTKVVTGLRLTKSTSVSDTATISGSYKEAHCPNNLNSYNNEIQIFAKAEYVSMADGSTGFADTSVTWELIEVNYNEHNADPFSVCELTENDTIMLLPQSGNKSANLRFSYIYDTSGVSVTGKVAASVNIGGSTFRDTIGFEIFNSAQPPDNMVLDTIDLDDNASVDTLVLNVTEHNDDNYGELPSAYRSVSFYSKALVGNAYWGKAEVSWTIDGFNNPLNSVSSPLDTFSGTGEFLDTAFYLAFGDTATGDAGRVIARYETGLETIRDTVEIILRDSIDYDTLQALFLTTLDPSIYDPITLLRNRLDSITIEAGTADTLFVVAMDTNSLVMMQTYAVGRSQIIEWNNTDSMNAYNQRHSDYDETEIEIPWSMFTKAPDSLSMAFLPLDEGAPSCTVKIRISAVDSVARYALEIAPGYAGDRAPGLIRDTVTWTLEEGSKTYYAVSRDRFGNFIENAASRYYPLDENYFSVTGVDTFVTMSRVDYSTSSFVTNLKARNDDLPDLWDTLYFNVINYGYDKYRLYSEELGILDTLGSVLTIGEPVTLFFEGHRDYDESDTLWDPLSAQWLISEEGLGQQSAEAKSLTFDPQTVGTYTLAVVSGSDTLSYIINVEPGEPAGLRAEIINEGEILAGDTFAVRVVVTDKNGNRVSSFDSDYFKAACSRPAAGLNDTVLAGELNYGQDPKEAWTCLAYTDSMPSGADSIMSSADDSVSLGNFRRGADTVYFRLVNSYSSVTPQYVYLRLNDSLKADVLVNLKTGPLAFVKLFQDKNATVPVLDTVSLTKDRYQLYAIPFDRCGNIAFSAAVSGKKYMSANWTENGSCHGDKTEEDAETFRFNMTDFGCDAVVSISSPDTSIKTASAFSDSVYIRVAGDPELSGSTLKDTDGDGYADLLRIEFISNRHFYDVFSASDDDFSACSVWYKLPGADIDISLKGDSLDVSWSIDSVGMIDGSSGDTIPDSEISGNSLGRVFLLYLKEHAASYYTDNFDDVYLKALYGETNRPLYETFYKPSFQITLPNGEKVPGIADDGIGPVLRGAVYADSGCAESADARSSMTVYFSEAVNLTGLNLDEILLFRDSNYIDEELLAPEDSIESVNMDGPNLKGSVYKFNMSRSAESRSSFNFSDGKVRIYSDKSIEDNYGNPVHKNNPGAVVTRNNLEEICGIKAGPNPATNTNINISVKFSYKTKNNRSDEPMPVTLSGKVFDMLGNFVTSLGPVEGYCQSRTTDGNVSVTWPWPCVNEKGRLVASGPYIIRVTAEYGNGVNEDVGTYKIVVLRKN